MLPGRSVEDVRAFFQDFTNDALNSECIVYSTNSIHGDEAPCLRPRMRPHVDEVANWTRRVAQRFSIGDSSGSVTSIAVRTGHRHGQVRAMMGACTTLDAAYNRSGELMLVAKNGNEPAFTARLIDGHKLDVRSGSGAAQRHIAMRQTVTSVLYDPVSDAFLSGGYDGRVRAWRADTGAPVGADGVVDACSKPIHSLCTHVSEPMVVLGTASGEVKICRGYASEAPEPAARLFALPEAPQWHQNTVDFVLFSLLDFSAGSLCTAIGQHSVSQTGVVEQWDIERRAAVSRFTELPGGVTWMSAAPCGNA